MSFFRRLGRAAAHDGGADGVQDAGGEGPLGPLRRVLAQLVPHPLQRLDRRLRAARRVVSAARHAVSAASPPARPGRPNPPQRLVDRRLRGPADSATVCIHGAPRPHRSFFPDETTARTPRRSRVLPDARLVPAAPGNRRDSDSRSGMLRTASKCSVFSSGTSVLFPQHQPRRGPGPRRWCR